MSAPHNHLRNIILDENLLSLKHRIRLSERNISIVESYVLGSSYRQLSEQYNVTCSRIRNIVSSYVSHCRLYQHRAGKYSKIPTD